MKSRLSWINIAIVLSSLSPTAALADWEGKVLVRARNWQNTPLNEITGTMSMRKDMTKLDLTSPQHVTTLIHSSKKTTWSIMHDLKTYTEHKASGLSKNPNPHCGTIKIDQCLRDKGLKVVNKETFNGHKCKVYRGEMVGKDGANLVIKVWRPETKSLKEVPSIRTVIYHPNGGTLETEINDIQSKTLADKDFEVPSDYSTSGDMMQAVRELKNRQAAGH